MATSTDKQPVTSYSIGKWTEKKAISENVIAKPLSSTATLLKGDVVLLQGRPVETLSGREYVILLAPAEVNRKLAIRQINEELEGWTIKSNTLSEDFL